MHRTCVLLAGLGAAVCAASPAMAAKPQRVQERLDALEQALAAQQARIERQDQVIEAQQAEIARLKGEVAAPPPAPVAEAVQSQGEQLATLQDDVDRQRLADTEQPRAAFPAGRPTLTSPDGRYSIALRATVQLDAAKYVQEAEGPLASDFRRGSVGAAPNRETNAARDLSDGAYFRRARLGVEGTFNRDFGFRFVGEFAGSGTEGPARINDAWISYTGFAPFTFQVGAYSPPANMDDGTSPEDTLFLERATPSELSRTLGGADGRLGAGVRFATPRWMGAATFTGRTVNDAEVFDSQGSLVGRLAHLVYTNDDNNLHLGASGTYVFAPADQGSSAAGARYPVRLRDRPELRVDSTRLIDTGSIDADHAWVMGLEAGFQRRNLYVQAEHFWYGVERRAPTAFSDPRFRGWYVQGSWVITGEPRRYNMASGAWQNPRPYSPFTGSGGVGAWELAVRYSDMDLNHHEGLAGLAPPADGVRGGEQRIWTFGLNWYPNANLKFALDYMHIEVERLNPGGGAFGAAPATPPVGAQIGQDLNALALRGQFGF